MSETYVTSNREYILTYVYSLKSVSYTHLDVYKRQSIALRNMEVKKLFKLLLKK